MKIFVCLKQVPDTETKIKIAADGSGIDTAGIKWVMNPYDEHAVEEAVKFKEKNAGAQVFAITSGPKARAVEALRTALAMGADEAIVINSPENLDAYSTAKALAQAITAEGGAHLIFAGKLSIDANQSSVPQMVAEFLNIPHTSVVSKTEYTAENVTVERDVEGGAKEVVQMVNPSLIAANKGLNMPRYASLPGIMKAKKKVIKEVEFSSLGIAGTEQKVKYAGFSLPPEKPAVKLLTGDAASQVSQLITALRDEAKVL
ncbi:electron transfer flavoprotein subunit beta/FixA family protein [Pseudobdellovibrio exovorus]|uniref:Electron transfer flavoprotein subunit beta n=1 Tax=Pseudobdellovibrio exovorus JSS TaxID=1184267 RepID=M4V4Y2_9BACT|nr:electron transfer flavoprotein subunit beta/FixA family protein [Pseudobdellovibrio exovorus]AGH94238.1 electron transfer flavoprotein beta-subunit [Pseudobdellovibrio exovorus JSS]